jgi:hypothetical protein
MVSQPIGGDLEEICEYGCGNKAKYIISSGKFCCKSNYVNCPSIVKKRLGKPHPKLNSYCEFCKTTIASSSHYKICSLNPNAVPSLCLTCGKPIFKSYNNLVYEHRKKFCSSSCSAVYNNKRRGAVKHKPKEITCAKCGTRATVNSHSSGKLCYSCDGKFKLGDKVLFLKLCEVCGVEFMAVKKRTKFCSNRCSHSGEKFKLTCSKALKEAIRSGRHPGWAARGGRNCDFLSFPEKWTLDKLKSLGAKDFTSNYKEDRFWIDFAWVSERIALEIDGSQHLKPENVIRD